MRYIRPMFIVPIFISGAILGGALFTTSDLWNKVQDTARNQIAEHFPKYDSVKGAAESLKIRLLKADLTSGSAMYIRIFKEESQLEVWLKKDNQFKRLHTYSICNWSGRLGPKIKEGDHQSPEGFYEISKNQLYPYSRHHLAFNIGFPNAYDRALSRTGTYLMVHGGCSSVGCYAVTNANVDEIYSLMQSAIKKGQNSVPVHIFPFRMTDARLAKETNNQWHSFWQELKTGHDLFEASFIPPSVAQCQGSYKFGTDASKGSKCQQIAGW